MSRPLGRIHCPALSRVAIMQVEDRVQVLQDHHPEEEELEAHQVQWAEDLRVLVVAAQVRVVAEERVRLLVTFS